MSTSQSTQSKFIEVAKGAKKNDGFPSGKNGNESWEKNHRIAFPRAFFKIHYATTISFANFPFSSQKSIEVSTSFFCL